VLDTFPYPGGTTTCEALWMGVPTVTLAGQAMLERQGASLLKAAGLGRWVTHTPAEFVKRAQILASDTAGLARLRASLRQQVAKSPLCDAKAFIKAFEATLRKCWQKTAVPRLKEARAHAGETALTVNQA